MFLFPSPQQMQVGTRAFPLQFGVATLFDAHNGAAVNSLTCKSVPAVVKVAVGRRTISLTMLVQHRLHLLSVCCGPWRGEKSGCFTAWATVTKYVSVSPA